MDKVIYSKKMLFKAIAQANNVKDISSQFSVEPVPAQKMRNAVQESSSFLKKINFVTRSENAGMIVGLSSMLSASRTDTATKKRQPRSVHSKEPLEYRLKKINFDTFISYDDLDSWINSEKNYLQLWNKKISDSKARSLLCIGFNGTHWADDTNFQANPLLQDCGIGWLQKLREQRPDGVYGSSSEPIKWGVDQEYKNLDALIYDATTQFIKEEFMAEDLVVLCNRRSLGDKYFSVINAAGTKATEIVGSDELLSTKRIGNLPAIAVSFFPENTYLVTTLRNLSVYLQRNGIRRKIVDEPESDRIANYESDNVDFVIEEPKAAVLIQNVEHIK